MSAGYPEFPTQEDWKRIYSASRFDQIFSLWDGIQARKGPRTDWSGFTKAMQLDGLMYEMRERLVDTARSYVFMMFFYGQGIPDKRWYVSPGNRGQSVQFFPDFKERHFVIKGWFDFYSDTSYYKLFSAWDLVGHILSVKYDLSPKKGRVNFKWAVKALTSKNATLRASLEEVRDSPAFQKANKLRNDISHNYLPYTTGIAIHRGEGVTGIGFKHYVPSAEIIANIQEALDLFGVTLQRITA